MNRQEATTAACDIRACLIDVRVNLVRTPTVGVYGLRVWDMARGTNVDLSTRADVDALISVSLMDMD